MDTSDRLLGQHAMQDGHLHRQAIEGLALDHRARTIQNFIGHRDIAAHGQAVHQLRIGQGSCEPALAHAPVREVGAQPRIRFHIAVVRRRTPLLGVHHARARERRARDPMYSVSEPPAALAAKRAFSMTCGGSANPSGRSTTTSMPRIAAMCTVAAGTASGRAFG